MSETKRDIIIYYAFNFLLGFYIANGTTVLFERVLNFSYSQIFTLGAVYMLMFTLFEVPSGAFADLVGRKKSIAAGCFFLALGAIATGLSHNFPQVFASFFLWALGFSCISGASEALLYDRLNDESAYSRVLGRSMLFGLFGTILAGVVGPYLFNVNFRYPYLASAVPFLLAGMAVLFIKESGAAGNFSLGSHWTQIVKGTKTAFHNKFIIWAMLVLALTFAVMYTMSNAYQPYLQGIGFPVAMFSFILPVMFLFEGLGGFSSGNLYKWLGENKLFWLTLFLLGLSVGFLGYFPVKMILVSLLVYTFVQGVARPMISVYSNRYISSEQRATVISVQSMFSTIAAALPLFLFGFLSDKFGINNLLLILGAIVLVSGILLMVFKPKTEAV